MIPLLTECRHANENKKAFTADQIRCGVDHARQQTQTLRTPTGLALEQFRLHDKTIVGITWSSFLSGRGRTVPLRESLGEELQAACMTAMISWPKCGSTVGTSPVISAKSRVWATRLDFAYEDKTRRPSHYSPGGRRILQTSEATADTNPDNAFSLREYFSELGAIPSEHDNATLEAVYEQWQLLSAALAVRSTAQIPGKSCGHDPVRQFQFCSNPWHPHSCRRYPGARRLEKQAQHGRIAFKTRNTFA